MIGRNKHKIFDLVDNQSSDLRKLTIESKYEAKIKTDPMGYILSITCIKFTSSKFCIFVYSYVHDGARYFVMINPQKYF